MEVIAWPPDETEMFKREPAASYSGAF